MRKTVLEAVLRSADAPSEAQRNRFAAFLKKQYGQEVPLRWEQDPALEKGFRMEVGADLYDWSLEGRLRQFRERLEQLNPTDEFRHPADAGGCPQLAAGCRAGGGRQRSDGG